MSLNISYKQSLFLDLPEISINDRIMVLIIIMTRGGAAVIIIYPNGRSFAQSIFRNPYPSIYLRAEKIASILFNRLQWE
jgi:hypothetical protein